MLKKLRSGALQFTVFIGLLIALLLGALVLYAYTFYYMKEQAKGTVAMIQLSNFGIDYVIAAPVLSSDTLQVPLQEETNKSIQVQLAPWGVFEKAHSKAHFRNKYFVKTAIIGGKFSAETTPVLYLQETQNGLSLVGTTAIKGVAFLPSQGVKTGYIAGNSFYGATLIDGSTEKSKTSLPPLSKNVVASLEELFKTNPSEQQEMGAINSIKPSVQSFEAATKYWISKNPIVLENVSITGNVIIKSAQQIQVKASSHLKDVILIAPTVIVDAGTKGVFQVVASKQITVHKNCELSYPSSLVLYQEALDTSQRNTPNSTINQIFIDSGTLIRGVVLYYNKKEVSNFDTAIKIESGATVKGQVYCNGNIDLQGTVSGTVLTKQFVANQAGSIYVNHIYNGKINNDDLPTTYGGLLFEQQPKTIMKWLY
jgi:hypothetical protein